MYLPFIPSSWAGETGVNPQPTGGTSWYGTFPWDQDLGTGRCHRLLRADDQSDSASVTQVAWNHSGPISDMGSLRSRIVLQQSHPQEESRRFGVNRDFLAEQTCMNMSEVGVR